MMENMPDSAITPETASEQMTSIGSILRSARETQGLTVTDVAERIKFSVKQVEALEADESAALPEGAFLRGFIRSYARTLHIDETTLLAMLSPSHSSHGDVSDVQVGGVEFSAAGTSNKKNIYLIGGALALAAVLGLFVWSQQESFMVEKVVIEDVKMPGVNAVSASLSPSVASNVSSAETVNTENDIEKAPPVSNVITSPKNTEIAKPALVPVKPVIPPSIPVTQIKPKQLDTLPVEIDPVVAVVNKSTVPLDQLKKRPIHILFSEDAWMEIVDKNGEVLLSRVTQAGNEKWIGGNHREPYKVAIGKVEAIKIFYKGREVDLTSYNQTGLVRLVLE